MDLSKLSQNQKMALGGGVLAIIASFMPWFGESGIVSWNAWDVGFLGWGGTIFVVLGAAVLLLKAADVQDVSIGSLAAEQIALLAAGFGTLLILLRFLFGLDVFGVSVSRKYGLFIAIIAAALATYGSFGVMKDEGLEMPTADDFKSGGNDT